MRGTVCWIAFASLSVSVVAVGCKSRLGLTGGHLFRAFGPLLSSLAVRSGRSDKPDAEASLHHHFQTPPPSFQFCSPMEMLARKYASVRIGFCLHPRLPFFSALALRDDSRNLEGTVGRTQTNSHTLHCQRLGSSVL